MTKTKTTTRRRKRTTSRGGDDAAGDAEDNARPSPPSRDCDDDDDDDDENDNNDGDDECGNDVLNYDRDRARIWASLVMTEVDDNGSNTTAMATTTTSIFSLAFDVSSSWGGWG